MSFHSKLAISACGRWLASGGPNGRAYTYDIGTTRSEAERAAVVLEGQTCEVTGVDWAADGQVCGLFSFRLYLVLIPLHSSPLAPTMELCAFGGPILNSLASAAKTPMPLGIGNGLICPRRES